jgi:hypothetical protein
LEERSGDAPISDWNTEAGNVYEILKVGAQSEAQLTLMCALLALAARKHFPSAPEQELQHAATLVWLTAHTRCRILDELEPVLSRTSDDGARALWQAVARVSEKPESADAAFGRTERLIAALALRDADSDAAREALGPLRHTLTDVAVLALLGDKDAADKEAKELGGEISPAPKGPMVTALLAFTFVLAAIHVGRLMGRYVFAYKRPAKLTLSQRGLEVASHTEMLGKVLREQKTLVPLSNLASVTREVRFARLGMYAGLVALVLGSYVGMGLFIDGLRVPGGSATLLGLAVLFILAGLVVDFGLSSLSNSVRGRCRILVTQRKGRPICIGALPSADADALLGTLKKQVGG